MSVERWYEVRIIVHEENDGATFLRRGSEPTEEEMSVEEARKRYSPDKVRRALEDALAGWSA